MEQPHILFDENKVSLYIVFGMNPKNHQPRKGRFAPPHSLFKGMGLS